MNELPHTDPIPAHLSFRRAVKDDIARLLEMEMQSFQADRISKRSFRRWMDSEDDILLLLQENNQPVGYGLVLCNQGTRLARLYSLALLPHARGKGYAAHLLQKLEDDAAQKKGRLFMRLEVSRSNPAAIGLYQKIGYQTFGIYSDYYDDHTDALRMQKTIRHINPTELERATPWYPQTTDFTCGPAALMMAMASLNPVLPLNQLEELQLWREATTIFMTSGQGGCHPIGLALAAAKRGFTASVYLNSTEPLFVDGVRSSKKKLIMATVHNQFVKQAHQQNINIIKQDISQQDIREWINKGYAVITLISTYRLDGKKAPHWVPVTCVDDQCIYVHEPDPDEKYQQPIDCQYVPIAREDFHKMSSFGANRLRTAVVICTH